MDVATHRGHAGEATRLAAVTATQAVGSEIAPALAGLTRLVADAMRAPIAAVMLVDSDRIRVIAPHHLAVSELPLTTSPAAQVVADRAPLFITDLRADPRFGTGPLTADEIGARSFAGVPLIDADGNVVGALTVLGHDAEVFGPDRRQLLAGFGHQVEALLALGRSASRPAAIDPTGRLGAEFLAMMTHEVRTPVSVITGYLELLDDAEDVPPRHRQTMTDAVRRNTERLVRLVDHLLLAAGGHEGLATALTLAPTDLTRLVAESVTAAQGQADLRAVTLELRQSPPVVLELDRTLIRTAVDNLVANALGFTPPGGRILVSVRGADAGHPDGPACVSVSDTGIGIPAEERELVFTQFYRGEQARLMESPGIGLGLTVTAAIAAAHAGRVRLDSGPGEGTTAYLSLPRQRTP